MKLFIGVLLLLTGIQGYSQEGLFRDESYPENPQANMARTMEEPSVLSGNSDYQTLGYNTNQTYFVISPVSEFKKNAYLVTLFPNPTPDKIYISAKNHEKLEKILITDMQGKELATIKGESANHVIDIRGLNRAYLLLTIITASGQFETYKVVKIQ